MNKDTKNKILDLFYSEDRESILLAISLLNLTPRELYQWTLDNRRGGSGKNWILFSCGPSCFYYHDGKNVRGISVPSNYLNNERED